MKKFFYMISTVAFMASFASCNKMEQGNTPAEAPSIDGTTTITVSATVPQTKTYLKDGKTFWTKGDIVTLMGRDEASVVATATASADGTQETSNFIFENWPVAATPEFLVFDGPLAYDVENYGGNKVMAPVLNEDGTVTAEVRKHQEIVNRSNFSKYANLSIGKLEGESSLYTAEMKNVCGLIKVRTTKEEPLEYIKIENLGESYITGVVKVDYNNGEPRVVEVLNGSKEVKLTSKISDTNNKLPASIYYACVLPGTYTPKVIMKPVGGDEVALTAKSSVTIERNKIMDFGEIDNINPEQPGTPDTPSATITITLNIASDPFNETLPSKNDNKKGPDTYTTKEGGYEFVLCNTDDKYAKEGSNLRLTYTSGKIGYIKFPAIPDYKLISVEVTGGNGTSSKKPFHLFAGVPDSQFDTAIATTGGISTEDVKTLQIEDPIVNNSYYLASKTNNAQFPNLVLTYSK